MSLAGWCLGEWSASRGVVSRGVVPHQWSPSPSGVPHGSGVPHEVGPSGRRPHGVRESVNLPDQQWTGDHRLGPCTLPELPDLTVYLDFLQANIVGQTLERIRIASPFVLRTADPPLSAAENKRVL